MRVRLMPQGAVMDEWLGHRDLCSIQWSDWCDCDPAHPVYLPPEPPPVEGNH